MHITFHKSNIWNLNFLCLKEALYLTLPIAGNNFVFHSTGNVQILLFIKVYLTFSWIMIHFMTESFHAGVISCRVTSYIHRKSANPHVILFFLCKYICLRKNKLQEMKKTWKKFSKLFILFTVLLQISMINLSEKQWLTSRLHICLLLLEYYKSH